MKFVVTGAAGHISKPLTELLLHKGHEVIVVGRSPERLAGLIAQGAKAAIGDLLDIPFLTKTFEAADGVYLMVPPMFDGDDHKKLSTIYAEGFSTAIRASGVKNAVFLSSYGAHRVHDAGAISGLGLAEQILNDLDGVNLLHLRAGYFYTNLLFSMDLVRQAGYLGNMFEIPHGDFTVVDPNDIAKAAARALDSLDFKGHGHVYVISDLTGTDEIAALIGKEIGLPDMKWVRFPPSGTREFLIGLGFAEGAADSYVEMFTALDKGVLFEHIKEVNPKIEGMKIEDFAKQFAAAYNK